MGKGRLEAFGDSMIVIRNSADSLLAQAIGKDHAGRLFAVWCASAIPLAFVDQGIADFIYVLNAAIWIVPDWHIEKAFKNGEA